MSKQTDKRIDDKIEINNYIKDLNGLIKCLKSELTKVTEKHANAIVKITDLEHGIRNTQSYAVKFIKELENGKRDFKDGTADGLLHGQMREENITSEYKQGYDFGLSLWQDSYDTRN